MPDWSRGALRRLGRQFPGSDCARNPCEPRRTNPQVRTLGDADCSRLLPSVRQRKNRRRKSAARAATGERAAVFSKTSFFSPHRAATDRPAGSSALPEIAHPLVASLDYLVVELKFP